ncbi:MAG: GSCFA domain-containing protein [Pseudomonadota bacterium]
MAKHGADDGLLAGTGARNQQVKYLNLQGDFTGENRVHRPSFRGRHAKFAPNGAKMMPVGAVMDYVLDGWLPDAPQIDRTTKVTAFGSCFAANVSKWLGQRNYRVSAKDEAAQNTYVVRIGEGMANSFVLRQQFEWAWEGKVFEAPLWHGYKAEEFGYDPEVQAQTKALFDQTDVFILTLGLSEVWYDEVTGGVFWRTVPRDAYDPERHKFRVASVEENRENLDAIYHLIRTHRPDAKVIFTLSPIPLLATFRGEACMTANSVSKASLRCAVDDVARKYKDEGALYYWPSYEIVTDVFGSPFMADRRHLPEDVLSFIMMQFEEAWCHDEGDRAPLLEQWVKALAAAGHLPPRTKGILANRKRAALERLIETGINDGDGELRDAKRALLSVVLESWDDPAVVAAE